MLRIWESTQCNEINTVSTYIRSSCTQTPTNSEEKHNYLEAILNPRKYSKFNGYVIHPSSSSACSRVITVLAMRKTRTPRPNLLDCWWWRRRRQRSLEKNMKEHKTQDITSDKNLKVEVNAKVLTLQDCACSYSCSILSFSGRDDKRADEISLLC